MLSFRRSGDLLIKSKMMFEGMADF